MAWVFDVLIYNDKRHGIFIKKVENNAFKNAYKHHCERKQNGLKARKILQKNMELKNKKNMKFKTL